MFKKFLKIFKKDYQTLNKIEISKENLLSNFKYLSTLNKKVKIAPVLKSNGYGHGILEIAKILDEKGCPFFCVDSLYEAYELLKAGVKTKVLIMGYTDPENFKVKKLPFSYAVFDIELAKVLNQYQPGCRVHIFVDTGMNREGVAINELPKFLEEFKKLKNIKIEGLMSHLASADNVKDPLNKIQINNFKKALKICKENGFYPKWIHFQNSDGLALHLPVRLASLRSGQAGLRGVNVNIARIGLALYGISANPNLKPIFTLKSKIIQIKNLKNGDRVGYGGTFTAKKSITLGVLPLGYYDGIDRRLSNKGWVSIDGKFCKIAGRVSMNITTIDLTNIPNPYPGQEVVVYSNNPKDKNSVENIARLCGTIPYVILIHLTASTKRIII